MTKKLLIFCILCCLFALTMGAQEVNTTISGIRVPACIYNGDTIPSLQMPEVYVFKPLTFKSRKQQKQYSRMVTNVKKTLPLAKEIRNIIIETYEYAQTLPPAERQSHLKKVEKSLKQQYTPVMKKLTLSQGKMLIKLVYRETNSTTFELVKAFLGSFRASIYQAFAATFGASLKKQYDPLGEDALIERIVLLVEMGIL